MANIYERLGQYNLALDLYRQVRDVFAEKKMEDSVAGCNIGMANVYEKLGQYERALDFYKQARNIFTEHKIEDSVAICDENMANIYERLDQYDLALGLYRQVRDVFAEKRMKDSVARCDMGLANIYAKMNQYECALDFYNQARDVFAEKGIEDAVAQCDQNMATIYEKLGQYERSLGLFEQAREVFVEKEMKDSVAKCDQHMANVYEKLGQYERSLELFKSARDIFLEKGMKVSVAECDADIAKIYLNLDQYERSLKLFNQSREFFAEKRLGASVAGCDANMANVYMSLGQYEHSLKLFNQSREFFAEKRLEASVAECDTNMANVYMSLGQDERALELFRSAREIFSKKRIDSSVASCDANMANIYRRLGQYERSLELSRSAREIFAEKGMDDSVASCDLNMANVHRDLGQYDCSLEFFKNIYETHNHIASLKSKTLYGMGKIFRAQKKNEQARRFYQDAIETIENTRKLLSTTDHRISFFETVYGVYHEMVDLCLEQRDFKTALEYVEQTKSRSLAEMLASRDLMPKNATEEEKREYQIVRFQMRTYAYRLSKEEDKTRSIELNNKLNALKKQYSEVIQQLRGNNPYFDPDQTAQLSYNEIRELVSDGESTLVEFFPLNDRIAIFVVLKNKEIEEATIFVENYNQFALYEHIKGLAERYQIYITSNGRDQEKSLKIWEDYLDNILKELYTKIFLKIMPLLEGIKKITIIPYGGFHLFPLHAVYTEKGGNRRYLLDDYQVIYAPSCKILKQCMDRKRGKEGKVLIAFANPKETGYLPFSQIEADAIKGLFSEVQEIKKATKETIIKHGKDANIFHYTGHAHLGAFILHNEKNWEEIEEYRVSDIFASLDLPKAHLAVLSACETGMIRVGKTDEYIGLTSALLHAGATTVISSLWSVSDVSTSLLMRKMYSLIKDGKTKASALREAQLWLKDPTKNQEHKEMLPAQYRGEAITGQNKASDASRFARVEPVMNFQQDFSRPYYWAGFICSGADGFIYTRGHK